MIRRALDFRYRGADRGLEVARFPPTAAQTSQTGISIKMPALETCLIKQSTFENLW